MTTESPVPPTFHHLAELNSSGAGRHAAVADPDWLDFANIGISGLLLLVTLLGSVAAAASLRAARKNNETAKLAILTELADNWSQLQSSWKLAQAIVRGIDDYYAPALRREEELVIRAHKTYQRNPFGKNLLLNIIRTDIEGLVQYFDRLSLKILEGVLTPADVYSILGSDAARHGRVVRWAVGAAEATPDLPGRLSREPDYDWTKYPVWSQLRGRRSRVIYLSDALWSELVRMRDLEPHQISAVALHKHSSGSGRWAQRRAFELAHAFRNRRHALRLSHHLTFAEYLPTDFFKEFGRQGPPHDNGLAMDALREVRNSRLLRTRGRKLFLLRFWLRAP